MVSGGAWICEMRKIDASIQDPVCMRVLKMRVHCRLQHKKKANPGQETVMHTVRMCRPATGLEPDSVTITVNYQSQIKVNSAEFSYADLHCMMILWYSGFAAFHRCTRIFPVPRRRAASPCRSISVTFECLGTGEAPSDWPGLSSGSPSGS